MSNKHSSKNRNSHKPVSSDFSRVFAFSDGVFAIVITLLIFEIKVPTSPLGQASLSETELVQALVALTPKLLSYAASFLIIGIYWTGHQAMFKHIVKYNRTFLWLNNLFLMTVCLMTFTTALLGSYYDYQSAIIFYAISLIATGGSLASCWTYATGNRRLVSPDLDSKTIRIGHQRILLAPLAGMISVLISAFSLKASLWVYLIAAVAYFLPSRIDPSTYE